MTDATTTQDVTKEIDELRNSFDSFAKMYQSLWSMVNTFPIPDAEKRDIICEFRAGYILAKEVMTVVVQQKHEQLSASPSGDSSEAAA